MAELPAGLADVPILRFAGDVTAVWYDQLDQRWRQPGHVLGGITGSDALFVLEVLAVPSPADPHARPWEPFASALDMDVSGQRIGWLGDWGGAYATDPGILETCEAALGTFADLGCPVEPVSPPFSADLLWDAWITLRCWSRAAGLGDRGGRTAAAGDVVLGAGVIGPARNVDGGDGAEVLAPVAHADHGDVHARAV